VRVPERSGLAAAVTIGDVARAAGVSTTTVSNVLNNRRGMAESTRANVLATIESLGYQRNPTARNLRAGRTDAVALLVPEFDRPYSGQLAERLAVGVEAQGRHLVVLRSGGHRQEQLAAAEFARLGLYDAVIITVVGMDLSDLEQLSFRMPVVVVGERPIPRTFDHVMMDNVGGAELATTRLIELGSRRIALLGGVPQRTPANVHTLRTEGFRKAHLAAGIPVPEELVVPVSDLSLCAARATIIDLVERGIEFDAVFGLTDTVATGALRGLADAGLRVPDDVQVVGFDDVEESSYTVPALTSIDPGQDEIASQVLRLLDLRVREYKSALPVTERRPPVELTIGARLIERETTHPAVSDTGRSNPRHR
jgi:DNA-binding LacI/PurR family transcriptional regulator